MKKYNKDRLYLQIITIISFITLLFTIFRKPPLKDWIIVYLANTISNVILDKILVKLKIVEYPYRFFPKYFRIHIIFDYLIYPTFTVIFNQMTLHDRVSKIISKLILISSPFFLIEYWAEKYTNLISWKRGWRMYHTVGSVIFTSLFTRMIIAVIRKMDQKSHVQ
ncbi:CBO0543 family protein [Bacillus sp. B1-b2]|uniref:CBO0543 family protein n=1 Tax=Bacillus sp. B1-b2 TaxID=2653201 RepID=UPI001262A110|nr:CBO0543 family protein [Bacillus sp. B1-b2]KAB7673052.1 hypothetical protein F9279_01110 [Bacillus sp. B1-b2]